MAAGGDNVKISKALLNPGESSAWIQIHRISIIDPGDLNAAALAPIAAGATDRHGDPDAIAIRRATGAAAPADTVGHEPLRKCALGNDGARATERGINGAAIPALATAAAHTDKKTRARSAGTAPAAHGLRMQPLRETSKSADVAGVGKSDVATVAAVTAGIAMRERDPATGCTAAAPEALGEDPHRIDGVTARPPDSNAAGIGDADAVAGGLGIAVAVAKRYPGGCPVTVRQGRCASAVDTRVVGNAVVVVVGIRVIQDAVVVGIRIVLVDDAVVVEITVRR